MQTGKVGDNLDDQSQIPHLFQVTAERSTFFTKSFFFLNRITPPLLPPRLDDKKKGLHIRPPKRGERGWHPMTFNWNLLIHAHPIQVKRWNTEQCVWIDEIWFKSWNIAVNMFVSSAFFNFELWRHRLNRSRGLHLTQLSAALSEDNGINKKDFHAFIMTRCRLSHILLVVVSFFSCCDEVTFQLYDDLMSPMQSRSSRALINLWCWALLQQKMMMIAADDITAYKRREREIHSSWQVTSRRIKISLIVPAVK